MNAVKKNCAALMVVALLGGSVLVSQETGQNIDPFYLQRLQSGEQAFLEGNYETAIEELKIALFGIQGEKLLRAKAFIYLGMIHYYLNNNKKAETYLKDANNLIGKEGLRDLITDESVWFYLNKIMVELKLIETEANQPQGTAIQLMPSPKKQTESTEQANIQRDLQQRIKSNPRNVSLYYELYEHYMQNSDISAAKKILKNLIKRNPDEAKGYYLLGRIQYRQRNLKDAEKNLSRVFELQKKVPVEEYVIAEARAYQILTIHLQGDRETSTMLFVQWIDYFKEEKIRFLDMDEQERGIFMGIAQNEATLAEIEKIKNLGTAASGVGQKAGQEKAQNFTTQTSGKATESARELAAGGLVPLDQVDTQPVLIKRVDPEYPPSAKALGIEGKVTVNALITEGGDVTEVVVVQGLAGGFNEATVTAVKQWKYQPAVKNGLMVKVWKPITITFKKQ